MTWQRGLNDIRNILADLYPRQDTAISVVAEAGIDTRHIDFSGSANDCWTKILAEAKKHDRVDALLAIAQSQFPTNQTLASAIESYHALKPLQDEAWPRPASSTVWAQYLPRRRILSFSVSLLVIPILYFIWIGNGRQLLPRPGLNGDIQAISTNAAPATAVEPVVLPEEGKQLCPEPPIYAASANFDERMLTIETTTFTMGDSRWPTSSPEQKITVASFLIDQFEVTNYQYQRFLEETGHSPPISWGGDHHPTGQAYYPVTDITWDDAVGYCAWQGKRLPTEVEWELACKGETTTPYPWGDEPDGARANHVDMACSGPITVGSFLISGNVDAQAADMLGNVSEWTSSLWKDYPYDASASEAPEGVENGELARVLRGGSYQHGLLTCANRLYARPESEIPDVGFRCAVSHSVYKYSGYK